MKMAENDEMDGLYGEGDDKGAPPASIDQEEQNEMQETAIVPTKLLQPEDGKPLKVGDEIVVRVKALHGDEAEVEYASSEAKPRGSEHETEPNGESADDELDRLGEAY